MNDRQNFEECHDNQQVDEYTSVIKTLNIKIAVIYMRPGKDSSKLVYSHLKVNYSSLTFYRLSSIISAEFKLFSLLRVYNYFGNEIFDTSDLKFLEAEHEPNKILFFCLEEAVGQINIDNYRLKCFRLIKKLGEGGFGKVYLAEQRFNKQSFAIKFLKIRASKSL